MRTFPKSLATFRKIVEERGSQLRQLSFEELRQLVGHPIEHITVESRPATIGLILRSHPSGCIQVVIQGSLAHRFMPGSSIATDGFYKYPDGTTSPMTNKEFWEFG